MILVCDTLQPSTMLCEKSSDCKNGDSSEKTFEESKSFIIVQKQNTVEKSVKIMSLAQIAANKTKQYTPYRVTKDGLKFKMLNNFFERENNKVVFFCGLTFYYGGSYMFEKDYKCADCQLHFLDIVNPSILKYQSDPSFFSEKQQIEIREHIDIWNAEIFEELTKDDPDVKIEMLISEHNSVSMFDVAKRQEILSKINDIRSSN